MVDGKTREPEWVTIDALLEHGEYPVIANLITLGQDIKNAKHFLTKLEVRVNEAVVRHTGLKVEQRVNGERRNHKK